MAVSEERGTPVALPRDPRGVRLQRGHRKSELLAEPPPRQVWVVRRRRVWAARWRRPWLVAYRTALQQKWPPPPRNGPEYGRARPRAREGAVLARRWNARSPAVQFSI